MFTKCDAMCCRGSERDAGAHCVLFVQDWPFGMRQVRGAKELAAVSEVTADDLLAGSEAEWSTDSEKEDLDDMGDSDLNDDELAYKRQRERELDMMFAGVLWLQFECRIRGGWLRRAAGHCLQSTRHGTSPGAGRRAFWREQRRGRTRLPN